MSENNQNKKLLLEVKDLSTYFKVHSGIVKAVNNVSFKLYEGESLGIIGESGCGKSVMAYSIMRLVESPPGYIEKGEILFRMDDGSTIDIAKLNLGSKDLRAIRGRHISMIFQTPMTAFSPVHNIGSQIIEMLSLHSNMTKKKRYDEAYSLLERVNIARPERTMRMYSHELSGGMCQRAMIAMAIAARPKILIADEPTTAVDVTIQAQVLALLREKQKEMDMAMIFITHDLGVIAQITQKVVVMYLGNIVERADVMSLFDNPSHPYTQALWKSKPDIERKIERLKPIQGIVPSGSNYPTGCVFKTRCTQKLPICDTCQIMPDEVEIEPDHFVRCFRFTSSQPAEGEEQEKFINEAEGGMNRE